jgi:putative ABC transport system substrate-binding protein
VRRRQFIKLFSGGAFYWPSTARAQQAGLPVVGYLGASARDAAWLAGFRDGLKNAGYVEGQNIAFEARWVEGQYDQLPTVAAELVRRPVTVIVAPSLPALSRPRRQHLGYRLCL